MSDAMADALVAAIPETNVKAWDDHGNQISLRMLGSFLAANLREQGWQLVRDGGDDADR